jgi:Cu/Ag efflux protein CusF
LIRSANRLFFSPLPHARYLLPVPLRVKLIQELVKSIFLLTALAWLLATVACSSSKPPSEPEKHYQLIGQVEVLNQKDQTATIQHQAIGDWMGAMTMEFPVRSKEEFDQLHVGDKITATVNVKGLDYDISGIRPQPASQ